jgi:hypothetical protein
LLQKLHTPSNTALAVSVSDENFDAGLEIPNIVSSFIIIAFNSGTVPNPFSENKTPSLHFLNSSLSPLAIMKSHELVLTFSFRIAKSETAVSTRAIKSFAPSFLFIFN